MLNYQIALTNVKFDNNYKNVVRFDNRFAQQAYFNISTLFVDAISVNFNIENLYRTNIIFTTKDTNLDKIMEYNYLIVKNNSIGRTVDYYYYFINSIRHLSGNQISCAVELDVFNTYYLDLDFQDCMINKAHTNRFILRGDGKYYFNINNGSLNHTTEPPKFINKSKTKEVVYNFIKDNAEANQWLYDNIYCWGYVFCDPYNVKNQNGDIVLLPTTLSYNGISFGFGCFAFPIYKNYNVFEKNVVRLKQGDLYPSIASGSFFEGLSLTLQKSDNAIYSFKISKLPPQNGFTATLGTGIREGDLILDQTVNSNFVNIYNIPSSTSPTLRVNTTDIVTEYDANIELDYKMSFTINELKSLEGTIKNIEYEPKVLGMVVLNYRSNLSSGYQYELLKLGTNKLNLKINSLLNIDTNKTSKIITTDNINTNYYENAYNSKIGDIESFDGGMYYLNNELYSYLQANKNATLTSLLLPLGQTVLGAGVAAITGGLGTAAGIGIAAQGASSAINYFTSRDNMLNTPNSLKGSSNGILDLSQSINDRLEVFEPTELDKQNIFYEAYKSGYNLNNVLSNPKNFDNIRSIFNFVQCQIENVTTVYGLNPEVREKIKEVYQNGLTFWNNTDKIFSYNYENLENEIIGA